MRSDMAKVIVERPRHGSRMRGHGKGYQRDRQRILAEELPKHERIKQGRGHQKSFNEHLGPLRRYLHKQVGRPWNKVFAEFCANISRDSVVQKHVLTHVLDYVATKLADIDGVLHFTTTWGGLFPLIGSWYRPLFYVCPKTGLLKRVKQVTRRQRQRREQPPPLLQVLIDHEISFVRKDGVWKWVRFEPYPRTVRQDSLGFPVALDDLLQNTKMTRADAVRLYGRAVIAKEVRRAAREEIRKYCEPLTAPNRV